MSRKKINTLSILNWLQYPSPDFALAEYAKNLGTGINRQKYHFRNDDSNIPA